MSLNCFCGILTEHLHSHPICTLSVILKGCVCPGEGVGRVVYEMRLRTGNS